MSLPPGGVGDKGQRYEVRCQGWSPSVALGEHSFGWTDMVSTCYRMVDMIRAHPSMHSPRIIDRLTGEELPLPRSN